MLMFEASGPSGVTPHTAVAFRSVSFARQSNPKNNAMLRWILIFFVVAIIAAVFGFTGIAGAATEIARILFFVFLVLLVLSALVHVLGRTPPQ
jgi:uncharacterized membrane protein YtjA (UPF0391 family)